MGTQTPDPTSSSELVLVNVPAQGFAVSNVFAADRPWSRIGPRVRPELKTSVRPSPVVTNSSQRTRCSTVRR